jgi:D-alanyl-D-alanine carboxypeptidase (penicillin-binding protein 5/6)
MYLARKFLYKVVFFGIIIISIILSIIITYFNEYAVISLKAEQGPPYGEAIYISHYTEGPKISAASAILIDATTRYILYAKNEHQRRSPASTTKIMTTIVALETGNLSDIVTVSQRAASVGGSSLWLKTGDKVTLETLIRGVLIRSGNDGSVAIAEHISGSQQEFVKLMNLRAKQLGALNTKFRNTHGLTQTGHYSTAYDLAFITKYALRFSLFAEAVSTKTDTFERINREWSQSISNTNKLLWSLEGADGVKTGTTSDAGYCLVASATRDGRQLISVVLHSNNRWRDSAVLLEYGFSEFELVQLAKSGEEVLLQDIANGVILAQIIVESDLFAIVRKHEKELIEKDIIIYEELKAPINRFDKVGEMRFHINGQEIGDVDLISNNNVKRMSILQRLLRAIPFTKKTISSL